MCICRCKYNAITRINNIPLKFKQIIVILSQFFSEMAETQHKSPFLTVIEITLSGFNPFTLNGIFHIRLT